MDVDRIAAIARDYRGQLQRVRREFDSLTEEYEQLRALQATAARDFTTHAEWDALLNYLEQRNYRHPFTGEDRTYLGQRPLNLLLCANRDDVDLGDYYQLTRLLIQHGAL